MKFNLSLRPQRRLPSALPAPLKGLLITALVLAAFMLANTLYLLLNRLADALGWKLFAASDISLPQLFQAMVLTHTGAGLLLVALMLVFAVTHLVKVWQRHHPSSIISGISFVAVGLTLAVTGLFILTAAASRDNKWAWWAHVICAALIPLGYFLHRASSFVQPKRATLKRFVLAVAGLVLILAIAHSFTHRDIVRTQEAQAALEKGLHQGPGAKYRDLAKYFPQPRTASNQYSINSHQSTVTSDPDGRSQRPATSNQSPAFIPTGFVPTGSPFFPSAATTSSGGFLPSRIITRDDLGSPEKLKKDLDQYGFVKETLIGAETCDRCHQDIVAQWATSAHRFSSFNNPFYEATINDMRENANAPNLWVEDHVKEYPATAGRIGMVKSKWCSGCHDPALMLAGKMDNVIDRNTAEAQAGLTCLACHAIDQIHNRTGNGNYNIADEQEDPYLFATAKTGSLGAYLHDAALKAKPTVHKRQMLKPFFRTSEFCATCHKVALNVPVNNYRWLRGQNEFDNWHDSGVALNASRTFYLPPKKRECQECHMPLEPAIRGDLAAKNGMVRSHRFPAVNTALPFLRGDQESIKYIEKYLRDEKLTVDIFAVNSERWKEPVMAIDRRLPQLAAGEKVTVDVVVRNKGVGHTFPGGTNDSNEGWLEFSLRDETGATLVISGDVGKDGHLDPMAHVYKALILDKHGNPIHKRNAQDIHVPVFVSVIGPGTADVAHYEFTVPPELAGKKLTMRARLLWRKFDRHYTEFAFAKNPIGFKQFDKTPDLPITEIAASSVTLEVVASGAKPASQEVADVPAEWMRFNDYGIASLLEGDTRRATQAFARVAALQPQSIEGPLNLAKTAVRDGNIDNAYKYLRQCEKIKIGDARVAWVWGLALQEDGRYAEAVLAYQRVLEQFPDDRAAWRNLGRTFYLDQQYEKSLEAFAQVLKIDPEDRVAHYHQMLCYRALGRQREAEMAAQAYELYQIDESAQEITRAYRAKDPGANLMAQPIRTHRLLIKSAPSKKIVRQLAWQ
ncbi:MAG: tetratricopeptide repeat protein [candidate division KSB1 bacterium]|nr:tetratricopeptide repeat protein [candidate division KSB1 bacterium]MDZ7367948.1 tetratricopeptide repeat protein [candidate division KSB1 bacterium]MDZ7405571.1 tetratricopeptide repeat protein [candidate division KSB1 bacterium]